MNLLEPFLVATLPVAFHYSILWGERILEPVTILQGSIGGIFNKHPLLFAIVAGLVGAMASQMDGPISTALWVIAAASWLADIAFSMLSFFYHIKKK